MAIQISRADVSSGEILDLQSETRFLKLPTDPTWICWVSHHCLHSSNHKCD